MMHVTFFAERKKKGEKVKGERDLFSFFIFFVLSFFLSVSWVIMTTAKSASYDYLIKLLLIGDSGNKT